MPCISNFGPGDATLLFIQYTDVLSVPILQSEATVTYVTIFHGISGAHKTFVPEHEANTPKHNIQ